MVCVSWASNDSNFELYVERSDTAFCIFFTLRRYIYTIKRVTDIRKCKVHTHSQLQKNSLGTRLVPSPQPRFDWKQQRAGWYALHTCFVAIATQPQTTRITRASAAAAIHLPPLTVTPHASRTVTKQDISWYLNLHRETWNCNVIELSYADTDRRKFTQWHYALFGDPMQSSY